MKKNLKFFIPIIIVLFVFYIGFKKTLPIPVYPLESEIIIDTLEKYNFYCNLLDDSFEAYIETENSQYTFNKIKNNKFFCSFLSQKIGEERILDLALPSDYFNEYYETNLVLVEDIQGYLAFSSELFGGFKNSNQVYNQFLSEYKKINTTTEINNKEESYIWNSKVKDITCKINIIKPDTSKSEEYVQSISFYSDMDELLKETGY